MAGKYNTWLRRKLADRIRSNAGYRASWGEVYPLSWTVNYYATIDTAEQAAKLLVEHGHFINEADLTVQYPDFEEWFNESEEFRSRAAYEHSQEQLVEDIKGNDEGMCMWSPTTAKRYGFDYTGPGAERAFKCEWDIQGRGGKHVCLREFDGITLLGFRDTELADLIDPDSDAPHDERDGLSNRWCRRLMGMLDEWDEALTDQNAERCGLYYQTDMLMRALTGEP